MKHCLLCKNNTLQQLETVSLFFRCSTCECILRDSQFFISSEEERERYLLHTNDVNDKGYQNFVAPLVNAIIRNFDPSHLGLDFGAGTGPVASNLLEQKGYRVHKWDPFFHPDTSVLEIQYDYIFSCEVIEHFHNPAKEFELLKKLLKQEGALFCKTEFIPKDIPFEQWYYKNDSTHVIFYSEATMHWIQNHFGFSRMNIEGRVTQFEV